MENTENTGAEERINISEFFWALSLKGKTAVMAVIIVGIVIPVMGAIYSILCTPN